MSLQRLRLRAAFVRCLSNDGIAPFPTIADQRVFDTRIGEIEERKDALLPFIAVYTDGDQRQQLARGDPRPTFARTIDVVIELAIGTWGLEAGTMVFMAPETDAELEALLDLLELQIWSALFDQVSPHATAVQHLVKEWVGWDSIPGRSPHGTNKITARQLTITCRVADDCIPDESMSGPRPSAESIFPAYLAPLVEQIKTRPALGSLKRIVFGDDQPTTAPAPPQGITFGVSVDFIDPVVDRSLLPDGQTAGPDGRIEIEADWQLPENTS